MEELRTSQILVMPLQQLEVVCLGCTAQLWDVDSLRHKSFVRLCKCAGSCGFLYPLYPQLVERCLQLFVVLQELMLLAGDKVDLAGGQVASSVVSQVSGRTMSYLV